MTGFDGVFAAPVLPMLSGGEIDWEVLPNYVDWLVDQGPAGIAVNMDAGEGHSLSTEERERVLELYANTVRGRCKVLAGIIANTTEEAVQLGIRAQRVGADAAVLFPPLPVFLGSPLPDELPYTFHARFAEAVELPLVAFQFPRGVGPDYSRSLLARLRDLPRFVAIKDASFDALKLIEVMEVMREGDRRISVLTGADQMLFENLVMGADGALIGFASTLTAEVVEMAALVRAGDLVGARRIWDRIGALARFAWRPPFRDYRPRMKEVLVAQGLFRDAAVRQPLLPLADAERRELRRLARQAGVLAVA